MSIKKALVAAVSALALVAPQALAAVNVTVGPTSLVTSPMVAMESSNPIGLFSFTLTQSDSETLSSVAVTMNNAGSSAATGSDLGALAVYKDDGDGNFEPGTGDDLAGSEANVNFGSVTTVTTGANNTIAGGGSKFFVSLTTDSSWSDSAPADSVTAAMAANAIVTSANSPTVTAVTTDTITADLTDPTLSAAVAKNSGGTSAKEAGDSVELTFSAPTNKPTVNSSNVDDIFNLNNGHSFLDGASGLGTTTWNVAGTVLTITLSAGTSVPTVAVGDTVTIDGSVVTDLAGNPATGSQTITGSFTEAVEDGDDDGDSEEGEHHVCGNTLVNGRLYMVGSESTVYLAAACRLKPFRGAAVFHARGMKFQNIIKLSALPDGATISQKPVLPAEGTLIKGSDKTVWFVDSHGKRRGFVSANVFANLGFSFGQVQTIADTDLSLVPTSDNIASDTEHPDGALIKCGNSAAVFEVIGHARFPFANAEAFKTRGHSFDHILNVDCGRFRYLQGAPVEATPTT
jgi:hypothetical protein